MNNGGVTIYVMDPGNTVLCDWCDKDFTDSPATGGIMFGSKATCPECTPRMEAEAKLYDETHYIRARCPEGMTFANWVRDILRKPS